MTVRPIHSFDDFQSIINSGKVVVIDFWATWCGPCRIISPVFDKLANNPAFESIGIYKVDVDEQVEISEELIIHAMPTFMVFRDGNRIDELVGANPLALGNLVNQSL
ncbi:thioredoxin [Russula dissimulans]|nr:thioredoxin [Russula dissimulans]